MEININDVREWALTIIDNTYHEKEIPAIKKQFLQWFDDEEGWYDVTTNPSDYMGQGVVEVFIRNFYK